jgi:hypothetical protein
MLPRLVAALPVDATVAAARIVSAHAQPRPAQLVDGDVERTYNGIGVVTAVGGVIDAVSTAAMNTTLQASQLAQELGGRAARRPHD